MCAVKYTAKLERDDWHDLVSSWAYRHYSDQPVRARYSLYRQRIAEALLHARRARIRALELLSCWLLLRRRESQRVMAFRLRKRRVN